MAEVDKSILLFFSLKKGIGKTQTLSGSFSPKTPLFGENQTIDYRLRDVKITETVCLKPAVLESGLHSDSKLKRTVKDRHFLSTKQVYFIN